MVNCHVSLKQHGQEPILNRNHLILSQLTETLRLSTTIHKVYNFLVITSADLPTSRIERQMIGSTALPSHQSSISFRKDISTYPDFLRIWIGDWSTSRGTGILRRLNIKGTFFGSSCFTSACECWAMRRWLVGKKDSWVESCTYLAAKRTRREYNTYMLMKWLKKSAQFLPRYIYTPSARWSLLRTKRLSIMSIQEQTGFLPAHFGDNSSLRNRFIRDRRATSANINYFEAIIKDPDLERRPRQPM